MPPFMPKTQTDDPYINGGFSWTEGSSGGGYSSLSGVLGRIGNNITGTTAQNEFSSAQAALNRDWQEYMSNTAHQREMADMKAAGLNPAMMEGGSGASTPSGSAASSNGGNGAMGLFNIVGSLIGKIIAGHMISKVQTATAAVASSAKTAAAGINAEGRKAVAKMYIDAAKHKAEIDDPGAIDRWREYQKGKKQAKKAVSKPSAKSEEDVDKLLADLFGDD